MKKQWMAVALSAGLSQMAMATTYKVEFEGSLRYGIKTVDCPEGTIPCYGFMKDLAVLGQPFSMSFTFEVGATPGQRTFSTRTNYGTDWLSGRAYESRHGNEFYSNRVMPNGDANQIPALPYATPNPLSGAPGTRTEVLTEAVRSRNVRSWTDDHQVASSSEAWSLTNMQTWDGADGSSFASILGLSSRVPFTGGSSSNYDDRESLPYFLALLEQSKNCEACVGLQWSDFFQDANHATSQVDIFGNGRLLSITEITAAVPEPSTYALMLAGVAGVGFAARRRRVVDTIKS